MKKDNITKQIDRMPDNVGRKIAVLLVTVVVMSFVFCAAAQFFFGKETYDTSRYSDVGNGRYADGLVLDNGRIVESDDLDSE